MKSFKVFGWNCACSFLAAFCSMAASVPAQDATISPPDFSVFGRLTEVDAEAGSLIQKGEYQKAKAPAEEVVRLRRKAFGNHIDTAVGLAQLGLVEMKLADYAAARSCYEQALAIYKKLWSENTDGAIGALDQLGAADLALKDYAAARSCYEKLYDHYAIGGGGSRRPEEVAALDHLNGVLRNIGGEQLVDNERAERAKRRKRAMRPRVDINAQNVLDGYRRDMANPYTVGGTVFADKPGPRTGRSFSEWGPPDYQSRLADANKVLEERRKFFGPDRRETALACSRVGFLYAKLGNLAMARSNYQEAVAINRRASGDESPDTLRAQNSLNHVLLFQSDPDAFARFRQQAASLTQRDIDPSNSTMIEILRRSRQQQ